MVILLDTLRQFFCILGRWPRSRIHRVRSRLSVQQCAVAHDGGVRPPCWYGVLCPGGLCWHWLVCQLFSFVVRCRMLTLLLYRLISASVGTIVHYGFQCYPHVGQVFLVYCLLTGIAGNIFPFMDWFNQYKYRVSHNVICPTSRALTFTFIQMWRITFFVSLAFTAVAPLAALTYLHGAEQMFAFVSE